MPTAAGTLLSAKVPSCSTGLRCTSIGVRSTPATEPFGRIVLTEGASWATVCPTAMLGPYTGFAIGAPGSSVAGTGGLAGTAICTGIEMYGAGAGADTIRSLGADAFRTGA